MASTFIIFVFCSTSAADNTLALLSPIGCLVIEMILFPLHLKSVLTEMMVGYKSEPIGNRQMLSFSTAQCTMYVGRSRPKVS